LPLAGILIFHRHGQCLASSDQYSEFFGPGEARVNKVSEEHFKMLGECRDNHRSELTALRFVDGDGIGKNYMDILNFLMKTLSMLWNLLF